MGSSSKTQRIADDRLIHLRNQQEKCAEGSKQWIYLQEHINQIVAQNYLEYVNS